MKNVKLSVVLSTLTGLLSVLKGKKIKSMNEIHQEVPNLISDYLKSLGLQCDMWFIRQIRGKDDKDYISDNLFTLILPNFIQDKRIKDTRSGKIVDICFEPEHDVSNPDMTIEEYYKSINLKTIEGYVERLKKSVKEKETELQSEKESLVKAEEELNSLTK